MGQWMNNACLVYVNSATRQEIRHADACFVVCGARVSALPPPQFNDLGSDGSSDGNNSKDEDL